MSQNISSSRNINKYFIYGILLVCIALGLYRVIPFIGNSTPLGYDPGLYNILFLEYYENLPNIRFDNLSEWNKTTYPVFLGLFGNILQLIGFSRPFLLTYGLGFFSIITALYLFIFVRKIEKNTLISVLAASIFLISTIQYYSFWLNYYKQTLGIIFILSGLYFLTSKKNIALFISSLTIFTLHRPSGVFFCVIILLYFILQLFYEKGFSWKNFFPYFIIGFSGLVAIMHYIPFWNTLIMPLITPLTTTVLESGKSGTFFTKAEFGYYNLFILVPSFYGLYLKLSQKKLDLITLGYLAGLIWVGFRLFFYSRMYIFFDVFIIILAAYGFYHIFKKNTFIFFIVFPIFLVFQSILYINFIHHKGTPLISEQEFEYIKKIPTIIPQNSLIMVTHRQYSPWIFGYTQKDTIAPGLFEWDKWTLREWKSFWASDGTIKCSMIRESYKILGRPLFIWTGRYQQQEDFSRGECFETIKSSNGFLFQKIKFD